MGIFGAPLTEPNVATKRLKNPPWTKLKFVGQVDDNGVDKKIYQNSRYMVMVRPMGVGAFGPAFHLSIKRLDQQPIHDWRDLQRIKNEIVGPEAEGVEIYPAESRMVDAANQYHLWCFTEYKFPFGFNERLVMTPEESEKLEPGASQRPFES
jgi:hypothetical protein